MHEDYMQRPSIDDVIAKLLMIRAQVGDTRSQADTFRVYD